jgi:hypothetical protein
MIRKITENERSCNGNDYRYVFERNAYKKYLTEGKFQQLYNECKNLALPQVSKCAGGERNEEILKAAQDFIEVEIKPRDLVEGFNSMSAYVAGFTVAFNMTKNNVDNCEGKVRKDSVCENNCNICGQPVGNDIFVRCDDCWDK